MYSMICVTSQDRHFRLYDPRHLQRSIYKFECSESTKPSRVTALDGDAITPTTTYATVSFTKDAGRRIQIWDIRNGTAAIAAITLLLRALARVLFIHSLLYVLFVCAACACIGCEPLFNDIVDKNTYGSPLMFYYAPQNLLMMSSKNDSTFKFFEFSASLDSVSLLNQYNCNSAHKGMCMGMSSHPQDLPDLFRISTETGIESFKLRRSDVLRRAVRQRHESSNYQQQTPHQSNSQQWFQLKQNTSTHTQSNNNNSNPAESLTTALNTLQPLLTDESQLSTLRSILTTTPNTLSTQSSASTNVTSSTDLTLRHQLLQLHQLTAKLLSLDSITSSTESNSNTVELKEMQTRVEQYQVLLGQASLEQKRLLEKIATLQKQQPQTR